MADADPRALRILKRCFTDVEWETLIKNPAFAQAANKVQNLEDIEKASMLGAHLLAEGSGLERDTRQRSRPGGARTG